MPRVRWIASDNFWPFFFSTSSGVALHVSKPNSLDLSVDVVMVRRFVSMHECPLYTVLSMFSAAYRRSPLGHEERFPPPRLSARRGLRKQTIARMGRDGRDAARTDRFREMISR
jgi:hypothetical protein